MFLISVIVRSHATRLGEKTAFNFSQQLHAVNANKLGDLNSGCSFPTAAADVQEVTHVGGVVEFRPLDNSGEMKKTQRHRWLTLR